MHPTIYVRTIKRFLIGMVAILVAFHLIGQFASHNLGYGRLKGFVPMFRLQSEHNICTYYSGLQLAIAGVLLLLISLYYRQESWRKAVPWLALCLMFWYLALDEVITIHEHFTTLGRGTWLVDQLKYKWVVMGTLLIVGVCVVFFRFWLRLPRETRIWFAIAAGVFITGAVGFETISGLYVKDGAEDFVFSVLVAFEEGLELAGIAIFVTALARYIQPRFAPLHIKLLSD